MCDSNGCLWLPVVTGLLCQFHLRPGVAVEERAWRTWGWVLSGVCGISGILGRCPPPPYKLNYCTYRAGSLMPDNGARSSR